MNALFNSGQSLLPRLILAVVFSIIIMVVDHRSTQMREVRMYLNTLISPLQFIANAPGAMLDWVSREFVSHQKLVTENERMKQENLLMSTALQRYHLLREENTQLRQSLGATARADGKRMIAELMAVDQNPYNHQVVINRGSSDGVYEGQPVLDRDGIVGQVQYVSANTSRVLLLADVSHNIPVRVLRNNLNAVVSGTGSLSQLTINHITHSADLQVGDLLVSSGLGKLFPEGYPVAKVAMIDKSQTTAFVAVSATPMANLNQLKYLVLLWPQEERSDGQP